MHFKENNSLLNVKMHFLLVFFFSNCQQKLSSERIWRIFLSVVIVYSKLYAQKLYYSKRAKPIIQKLRNATSEISVTSLIQFSYAYALWHYV